MTSLTIPKGERRRVLHLVFDSIPQKVRFSASPAVGAGPVAGKVEVIGSRWLFRRPVLEAENVFRKGFRDGFYEIWVTPEQDTEITFTTSHFRFNYLLIACGVVIALAVASVVAMAIILAGSG